MSTYTVKAGETIEIPELPGVIATNHDDTTQLLQVVDGVVEVGPVCFTDWEFRVTNDLLDMPVIKHA